jgi:hypothetical protein
VFEPWVLKRLLRLGGGDVNSSTLFDELAKDSEDDIERYRYASMVWQIGVRLRVSTLFRYRDRRQDVHGEYDVPTIKPLRSLLSSRPQWRQPPTRLHS